MNDRSVNEVHWSFWFIAVIALIWNLGGAINYLMQLDKEFVSSLPATHRAIIQSRPVWATGGFAIGVFAGVLGCLLLLLRKPVAFYVFAVSLLGILVTMIHAIDVAISHIEFSPVEVFRMILSPIIVSGFLLWFTKKVETMGWLG